jgi:hypothetical protein
MEMDNFGVRNCRKQFLSAPTDPFRFEGIFLQTS